jgi:hypothetical protein
MAGGLQNVGNPIVGIVDYEIIVPLGIFQSRFLERAVDYNLSDFYSRALIFIEIYLDSCAWNRFTRCVKSL